METASSLSLTISSKHSGECETPEQIKNLIDRATLYDGLAPLSTNLCMWIINYGVGLEAVLKDKGLEQSKFFFLTSLLSQANQSIALIEKSYPQKNIMTAMKIVLNRCSELLVELRQLDLSGMKNELIACSIYFGVATENVLDYFEFHTFYATASYYRFMKSDEQSNENYMESFKILLKYGFRDIIDFIFLIVDYTTGILLKFKQKLFKQFHYLLYAAKTLMDELKVEKKQCEPFKKLMRYWLYACMLYGIELLDNSYIFQRIEEENAQTESITIRTLKPVKTGNQCIEFDNLKLNPQMIEMPDNLLKSATDIKAFYGQLMLLKDEMYVWGPLKISPEISSYEIMYQILLRAVQLFPDLKDIN